MRTWEEIREDFPILKEKIHGKDLIYLDNAATTQMSDAVKQAMEPYLQENYGNASTAYSIGEDARRELEKSREVIAATLHAKT